MRRPGFILILGLIVALGAYLRLQGLSRYSFWVDELYHVFAAKNLIAGNGPLLPSGVEYDRSLFFTYLVAASFKLFGTGEAAARLPSALTGILMIAAAYLTARKLLDKTTGLILAALVALSPYLIAWSQVCRMYPLFQLLYLLLVCAFFHAWESPRGAGKLKRFVPAAMLFALSLHVHELTLLFVPSVVAYFGAMTLSVFLKEGGREAIRSRYAKAAGAICALAAAGFAVVKLLCPGHDPAGFFTVTPVWAMHHAKNVNYYRELLHTAYPLFTALYPLSLALMLVRKGRCAVYCACAFIVPFLMLSLVFPWKDERYLFFIFPLFLLPAAFLLAEAGALAARRLKALATDSSAGAWRHPILLRTCAAAIVIPALAYPALFPWIKTPPRSFIKFALYDFHPLAAFIDRIPKDEPLIVTQGLYIRYYSSRQPDYQLPTFEFLQREAGKDAFKDEQGRDRDQESGLPIIAALDELKKLERESASVWFITDNSYMKNPSLDKEYQDHIKTNYRKLKVSDNVYYVYNYRKNEGITP